jgi:hypothetical protein
LTYQRSGFGSSGGNDDGVLHGVVLLKSLDKLGDGGTLLTNGDVDTVKLLRLVGSVVDTLLVENGVESDGSLSGLTVTNDQLTLTTSDGHHGVDGLETSLHGLADGLTGKNTRSLHLSTASLLGVERALAVNGVSEGVDDTAEKLGTDRNVDLVRELDSVAAVFILPLDPLTIFPVRLTLSPSRTNRSEPKSTTPTWPASRFMHIPVTPDANLD